MTFLSVKPANLVSNKTKIDRLVDCAQRIVRSYTLLQYNSVVKQLAVFSLNGAHHARRLMRTSDSSGPLGNTPLRPGLAECRRSAAQFGCGLRRLHYLSAFVGQIGPKPALHFGDGDAFAAAVVGHLVAIDFTDAEVPRLRVR